MSATITYLADRQPISRPLGWAFLGVKKMTEDEWVKKLNNLGREMDEIAASVHPSVVAMLTADLRKKYREIAQSNKVTPNGKLT